VCSKTVLDYQRKNHFCLDPAGTACASATIVRVAITRQRKQSSAFADKSNAAVAQAFRPEAFPLRPGSFWSRP
jgi:hypothetical protein